MKRFLTLMAMVAAVVAFSSCNKDNGNDTTKKGAPTIEWPGNTDFDVMDIDENLDASLTVKAPAGIKTFVVEVESAALESVLAGIHITTTTLDLINDDTVIAMLTVASKGTLPMGDKLLNQTEVTFDIASLVNLISTLPDVEDGSEHTFNVTLSDNNDKTANASCTFRVVKDATTSQAE